MQLIIGVRRETPELGWEEPDILDSGDRAVLGLTYTHGDDVVVVLHNLGRHDTTADLKRLDGHRFVFDILADQSYDAVDDDTWKVPIDGYGYRWFRARRPERHGQGPSADAATGAL